MHLLFSFERRGANLEVRILMFITGIPAGQQAVCGSRLEMLAESTEGILYILLRSNWEISRDTEDKSRADVKENLQIKHSTFSTEGVNNKYRWRVEE